MLVLFGADQLSTPVVLMALPIALYEMILAVWLIVKGFNPSAVVPQATRTGNLAVALVP